MKATVSQQTADIANAMVMPQVRNSIFVPLNKLVLAEDQVRKTPPTEQGISEMAAMLLAQGQLHALQVSHDRDTGLYAVHAGGRRLRGFQKLASDGKIMPDFPVECKEVDDQDATAIGLTENISQEAMHPADQFEAFKTLTDQGRSIDSIATQFGVTPLHVQRRLKLASLAPALMVLYRKGEIQLDQVMALVQLDDQTRQVALWKGLSTHNRSASTIRRLIAQDEVPASDPRVKVVGLTTYLNAGGGIRADLFAEKNERFLTDPLLLEMLVGEAFEVHAAELREQGLRFIDVHAEWTYTERQLYFTLPAVTLPESPIHKAKRMTLEAEQEALEAQFDACDDDSELEELQTKIDAVDEKLAALSGELVSSAGHDKDLIGVVLTLEDGKIKRIENQARVSERKQIMAEIAARQKRHQEIDGGSDAGGKPTEEPAGDETHVKNDATIPERLMMNLTAQRTAAIQACMITNQKVALAALAHRLAMAAFNDYLGGDEAIKISRVNAWHSLEKASPTVGTSRAAGVMGDERTRWESLLPQDKKVWLQWFIDQPLETSLSMLVFSTAETVNAVRGRHEGRDVGAALAKGLDLDMKTWWEPTPENYLDLVPKAKLVEAVTEAKGPDWAKDLPKMKKQEAVAFAAEALAGTGWLPNPLRD